MLSIFFCEEAFFAVLQIRNLRLDPDPELLFRIRIQQKIKEEIDKNFIPNFRPVNSGLFVL